MNKETQVKQNLSEFLKQLKQNGERYQLLENVIENNLKYSKGFDAITNIEESLIYTFQTNSIAFFDYISFHRTFEIGELDINQSEYKKVLEYINVIKFKFGSILEDLVNKSKDPFIIAGFQSNVREGESTHLLRIIRNDGETFETNFKPGGMLTLVGGLIGSVRLSLEIGVYNINQEAIDKYLSEAEALKKHLESIISASNNE